jgi:hypothetical protein
MGELLLALNDFGVLDGNGTQAGKINVLGTSCPIVKNVL